MRLEVITPGRRRAICFVVGLNTHPNEFPRNYYGTHVTSPRRVDDDRLLSTRMSSTQASARPWRDPPVSPRNLPKLRPTMTTRSMDGSKPWGGSKPLPWMVCPDGSMADEMNVVPKEHYKRLMQEAKDAAMADGELDENVKLALENPKERTRALLNKTAAQIADDQKVQLTRTYSIGFRRRASSTQRPSFSRRRSRVTSRMPATRARGGCRRSRTYWGVLRRPHRQRLHLCQNSQRRQRRPPRARKANGESLCVFGTCGGRGRSQSGRSLAAVQVGLGGAKTGSQGRTVVVLLDWGGMLLFEVLCGHSGDHRVSVWL